MINRLTTGEIAIFKLVSVADQAGLNLNLSETLKTGFLTPRPILSYVKYMQVTGNFPLMLSIIHVLCTFPCQSISIVLGFSSLA